MELNRHTSANNLINNSVNGIELKAQTYSLISIIVSILETIIIKSLRFNQLTSIDDIYREFVFLQKERFLAIEYTDNVDIKSIENICEFLCTNNDFLIKIEKNGISYYKLNLQENILDNLRYKIVKIRDFDGNNLI